jgi:predicted O-methyltransferase YrrM
MDYDACDYQNKKPSHFECEAEVKMPSEVDASKLRLTVSNAMDQLTGWCTKFKAFTLIDIILEKRIEKVVEIGVWGGRSLVPMAFALKELGYGKVYGIDPWSAVASVEGMDKINKDWWGAIDHEAIYQDLAHKVHLFGLVNHVKLIKSTSVAAEPINNIGLLHIDGNHSEEASLYDVMKWAPFVKKGGLIVFDDVTWGTTAKAVQWLDANFTRIADYHEDCDWSIWIKE